MAGEGYGGRCSGSMAGQGKAEGGQDIVGQGGADLVDLNAIVPSCSHA